MNTNKDPDAILDYRINWQDWLGPDTIETSEWIADAGLTVVFSSNTIHVTTVWLSGGVAGNRYKVVNRITTAMGRTDDRTLNVQVVEK